MFKFYLGELCTIRPGTSIKESNFVQTAIANNETTIDSIVNNIRETTKILEPAYASSSTGL